jgi:signal transduction histidine kinase
MASRSSHRRAGGVPPAWRDLVLVVLILVAVDAVAAWLLAYVYFPARRDEVLARTPPQLSLLARDRQNALAGWVRERLADAELTASLLGAASHNGIAPALLDRFIHVYGYESALIVDDTGALVLRRGSADADAASIAAFVRPPRNESAWIDFRRLANGKPRILTASRFEHGTVVFVSNPYDYVYPLFTTFAVASKTGETNLIGLYRGWGVALNPYAGDPRPPMTSRRPIPKEFADWALESGERSIRMKDRDGMPVIGVVKVIPRTPWIVFAKIDEEEVLASAVDETVRLGQLIALVSVMLATIAFTILRSRRVHKLRAAEQAVRGLSARLLRIQDETRRRIARELHETVAQSLAGLRMNLGMIKRLGGDAEIVDDSITIADDALTEVRTMSYLLHPPMIDQAGLVMALRWYVDGFQQRSGITTTLDAPDDLGALPRDVETSVFRIVQESLTNVQRHSGSTTAGVSVERDGDRLSVGIADHGRGVPPTLRDDHGALLASGVGLAGINERVHELRGALTIRSSEQGTTVRVTLPVPGAA